MRIVSLLPSATEIVCALGLREELVGVSHECDFPASVVGLPRLTRAKIDATQSSAEISREVSALAMAGLSVYAIDENALGDLHPDVIVTQDTCEVCAVSLDDVCSIARRVVGTNVDVVSLSPLTLDEVYASIRRVGDATNTSERARALVGDLQRRLATLEDVTRSRRHPRVVMLEWLDPPMTAGHWSPELIRLAGGTPVACHDGKPTRAGSWSEIAAAEADFVLIAPCGFGLEQTLSDLRGLRYQSQFAELAAVRSGNVALIDGNAYFNRPGPRLVETAEIAARALHGPLPGIDTPAGALLGWRDALARL